MKTLLKLVATAVLALGLTTGLAAAQSATVDTTGPSSDNVIRFDDDVNTDISVKNDTEVKATVNQDASSGDADVKKNTNAGDAQTGDAENAFEGSVAVENDNSGTTACGCNSMGSVSDNEASLSNTGPHSDNKITFDNEYNYNLNVKNDTDVKTTVNQSANTGSASVYGNTNGGSASTGSASNHSALEITVSNKN